VGLGFHIINYNHHNTENLRRSSHLGIKKYLIPSAEPGRSNVRINKMVRNKYGIIDANTMN
jgi:hypothetical protein